MPVVSADLTETTDFWWDDDWPYRVQVITDGSGITSGNLNFTALFDELGLPQALLNLDSIRVIPYQGGVPGSPIPYQETYSTLFLDLDTLNKDKELLIPYWVEDESTVLELVNDSKSRDNQLLYVKIEIKEESRMLTGFDYVFNSEIPVDWSDYEIMMYDVWPEVNQSAIDQTPDLYYFKLETPENHPCAEINGPAQAMNQWNTAIVSLDPLSNCDTSILSNIRALKIYVRVNQNGASYGNFDVGDELHLWLDNFRLVDQDGDGEIIWETIPDVDTYYIYFDTINHLGHPPPEMIDDLEPTIKATHGLPQAGGYFHLVSGAQTEGLDIWQAPVVEKIFTTNKAPFITKPLALQAARGEFAPFQLIINSETAQSATVMISDLQHHSTNAVIAADQVQLFRVDYINVTKISDYYGRIVPWPDPLYPIMMGDEVPLQPGMNQPLWFRIKVPPTARPGVYEGSISIGTANFPMKLEVWNFTLPTVTNLQMHMGFDWEFINTAYKGVYDGIPPECQNKFTDTILKSLSEYRLTPVSPGEMISEGQNLVYSLSSYEVTQAQSLQKQEKHAWWSFIHSDTPPLPNPAVIDRSGMDARILPWLAWLDRVDGLHYTHANNWEQYPWSNPSNNASNGNGFLFYPPKDDTIGFDPCDPDSNRLIPSIRLELLREGLEDYTYMWMLNGGAPEISLSNLGDIIISAYINSRTTYIRNPIAIYYARLEIANQILIKQIHQNYLPLILR